MKIQGLLFVALAVLPLIALAGQSWSLVDDFESPSSLKAWTKADTRNDTLPRLAAPQVTERRLETALGNHYLIKKPAPEGVVGNRKALTYRPLPVAVAVGETYTFYTRIKVESFPNNHVFGLSNVLPKDIETQDYNAFEPTLRITDKVESDGFKNDGTLMVGAVNGYAKIQNTHKGLPAKPLVSGVWYEIWYVIDNRTKAVGGQTYDVYIRGGEEFRQQSNVYKGASFRMARELPLIYFLANCNTGPAEQPYGNGGLMYDDIYMAKGTDLSRPF